MEKATLLPGIRKDQEIGYYCLGYHKNITWYILAQSCIKDLDHECMKCAGSKENYQDSECSGGIKYFGLIRSFCDPVGCADLGISAFYIMCLCEKHFQTPPTKDKWGGNIANYPLTGIRIKYRMGCGGIRPMGTGHGVGGDKGSGEDCHGIAD